MPDREQAILVLLSGNNSFRTAMDKNKILPWIAIHCFWMFSGEVGHKAGDRHSPIASRTEHYSEGAGLLVILTRLFQKLFVASVFDEAARLRNFFDQTFGNAIAGTTKRRPENKFTNQLWWLFHKSLTTFNSALLNSFATRYRKLGFC